MKCWENIDSINLNKIFNKKEKEKEYNEHITSLNCTPYAVETFQRNPTYKITPWDYNAIMNNELYNKPLKIND